MGSLYFNYHTGFNKKGRHYPFILKYSKYFAPPTFGTKLTILQNICKFLLTFHVLAIQTYFVFVVLPRETDVNKSCYLNEIKYFKNIFCCGLKNLKNESEKYPVFRKKV